MKTTIFTLTVIAALTTFAKPNFNDIIVENNKAQNELHQQIKASIDDVKVAVKEGSKTISIAAVGDNNINVKSNKSFLTFSKEKKYFKASDIKANKRLAEELQNLE